MHSTSRSNARLEGLHNKIRLLSHRSYGLHSPQALIALIYLCCAGITITPPLKRATQTREAPGSVAIVATDGAAESRLTHVLVDDLPKLAPDLETWLRAYVTARHTNDVAEFQAVLSAIVERVWSTTMGPLHEHLQQVGVAAGSSVVIVPPAGFSILPLAAASPHDGMSFLDLYATSFSPSVSRLIEATRETSSSPGITALHRRSPGGSSKRGSGMPVGGKALRCREACDSDRPQCDGQPCSG